MTGKVFILAALASVTAGALMPSSAAAQIFHTWVASNGSDAAACGRATPCATFTGALAKTAAGGEITCVDSGSYGQPLTTINKAITINCEAAIGHGGAPSGTDIGFITVTGTVSTDVVTLRGLDLDGYNATGGSGFAGLVSFNGAGTLRLEKMKISNNYGPFHGVLFVPSGAAKLHVMDSVIANNTTTGVGGGILIRPGSGVTASVAIERSVIDNNRFGVIADGSSGGAIRGVIADSSVSGNANNGITVSTSGPSVVLSIDNTRVSGNNFGLVAAGASAGMLVGRSVISANNTGLSISSGGVLLSYRDNRLNANTTDGAFTGPVGLQ